MLINVTSSGALCTGALVHAHIVITSPACFLVSESAPTQPNNPGGAASALGGYPVLARGGASGALVQIGTLNYQVYVYAAGTEGYSLSLANVSLSAAGSALALAPYPFNTVDVAPPASGFVAGYGPSGLNVTLFGSVPIGAGVLRAANATMTSVGLSVIRIGNCSGLRTGGVLNVENVPRFAATYSRMCGYFGDMGSPLFLPGPPARPGALTLMGVMGDVDVYPCAVRKAVYTSTSYRQAWIRDGIAAILGYNPFPPERCVSPSVTASPTLSPSRSPSSSATPSASPIIPIVYVPTPFPWWKVIVFLVAMAALLLAACAVYLCARWRWRSMRAVAPFSKADMAAPHVDHVVSGLTLDDPELYPGGVIPPPKADGGGAAGKALFENDDGVIAHRPRVTATELEQQDEDRLRRCVRGGGFGMGLVDVFDGWTVFCFCRAGGGRLP